MRDAQLAGVGRWLAGAAPRAPVAAAVVRVAAASGLLVAVHVAAHVAAVVVAAAAEAAAPHRRHAERLRVQLALRSPVRALRSPVCTIIKFVD